MKQFRYKMKPGDLQKLMKKICYFPKLLANKENFLIKNINN